MRHFRLGVIALFFLVTTACGGVENEPNLAKAAERTAATGSSRIEVRGVVTESGGQLPLRCEGAADYERNHLRLTCDIEIFGLIVIGDTAYFKSDGLFGVRAEKNWLKVSVDESDSINNFAPERLLRMLRDASLETTRVGEETVREVTTVRYRLTVNCDEAEIGCAGRTTPVDVWVDDDGLVRRIELEDDGSPATIEFFDFGVDADIEAPPADQVADIGDFGSGLGTTCRPDAATPIGETQALDAFRSHGLTLHRDGSGYCPPTVAAVLENAPENFDREGHVSCFLHEKPPDGAPKNVVRRGVDGGDAQLLLANLTCSILADSPKAEEKIRPLEQAFEELERAIRP